MKEKLIHFTLQVITADMALNWFLGFMLTLLPLKTMELVMEREIFSPLTSQICMGLMGVAFLVFAGWQMGMVRRWTLTAKELKLGALMAWWPVVLLTIVLLSPVPFKPVFRVVLWVGNVYMLVLGVWYWWVAKRS